MKNNLVRAFYFVLFFLVSGCSAFSAERIPYSVSADFVMEENSDDYKICGADILFYNNSDITVKEFVIAFYLFDSEGEPAQSCSSLLTFDIEKEIEGGELFKFCLSLDSYMTVIPQELLEIDYLYVSKIIYDDGSVWEDPYGLVAFK